MEERCSRERMEGNHAKMIGGNEGGKSRWNDEGKKDE